MTELRRLWNVLRSHAKAHAGSPRFVTVHSNDGFGKKKRTHISKKYTDFKKYATINTGYDVKKQYSQPEMTFISIYHLNQSGMRLIKLLNCLRHV